MQHASPRFVMLQGIPGAGKSSLAADLAAALIDRGATVDLIPEEDIFTRREFVDVGRGFTTRAWPTAVVMLAAYSRVLRTARLQHRWVIADWNCVGMIEDLPWAQPDRAPLTTFHPEARADRDVLTAHARDVRSLAADLCPILLHLNVPSRVAVLRAAAERGQAWIERSATPVHELTPGEPLIDRIVRGNERDRPRQRDIIAAYTQAGWDVAEIDANCARTEVLHQAMQILLAGAGPIDHPCADYR
jgi:chloramphenicol 3-O-phosphotransferase